MTTNLDLSNSDKKILSLICEDLSDKKLSLTLENIRKHYLFDKIEQKDLFVGSDSMYPISIRISQPEPDKLSIEIVGSKICVKNMLHAKFLEGCITEFS